MWISPVRELVAKDLAMITHFHHLKTVAKPPLPLARNQASINGLAERFIAGLQVGMPSTVHAVLGTACKLQSFPWNCQIHELVAEGTHICGICSAPLEAAHPRVGSQMELACRSCQQQLWGKSPSATRALPTQALAAEIPSLFTQDKLGEFKDDHKDTHAIKLRSTQWMQDQLNDCLL